MLHVHWLICSISCSYRLIEINITVIIHVTHLYVALPNHPPQHPNILFSLLHTYSSGHHSLLMVGCKKSPSCWVGSGLHCLLTALLVVFPLSSSSPTSLFVLTAPSQAPDKIMWNTSDSKVILRWDQVHALENESEVTGYKVKKWEFYTWECWNCNSDEWMVL